MSFYPDITTFAGSKHRVKLAIEAGIDHLILEDSKVSLRSFENHFSSPDFLHLIEMANYARALSPDIKLSANCDLLVHERHYPILEKFYLALKQANISSIRIQDPGLIVYFKSVWPDVVLHFSQETGNHNLKSIGYYATCCTRQVLNNELTVTEIKQTIQSVPCEFEIQVQGPILLQYSNRRFMLGHTQGDDSEAPITLTRYANDHDYPGREFVFHDNPHGHFMFAYFDRCLLRSIPDLNSCGLTSWLIDARGESDHYFVESLTLYQMARFEPITPADYAEFEAISRRAQKPGFFKANFTDRVRKSPYGHIPNDAVYVGTIVDVIREQWVTIKCDTPFSIGDSLLMSSPRAKVIEQTVDHMKDVLLNDISTSKGHYFVLLKWRKGMLAKSRIYRRSHDKNSTGFNGNQSSQLKLI